MFGLVGSGILITPWLVFFFHFHSSNAYPVSVRLVASQVVLTDDGQVARDGMEYLVFSDLGCWGMHCIISQRPTAYHHFGNICSLWKTA